MHSAHSGLTLDVARDDASLVGQVRVPTGATHACIRFRFSEQTSRGEYLELIATQTSDGKRQLANRREILGQRVHGRPVTMLVPLLAETRQLQLVFRNAYGARAIGVRGVDFVFLNACESACPLGAVGLISPGIDQVADLLRDIADHYEHYRQTAADFAPSWGGWHSPEKVVRLLCERSSTDERLRTARLRLPKAA